MSENNYREENALEYNDNERMPDEDCVVEGFGPVMRVLADRYCDNLINPDEDKCIEPKKLYITLGASVIGSVLVFLLIGWLLCYCPLNTTGYSAKDFIREFNSIAVDDQLRQTLEGSINAMIPSGSDIDMTFVYPDFSDLAIPEDADLEEGVRLCNGNMVIKADLIGGNIQKLTIGVNEDRPIYDSKTYKFAVDPNADFDYSALAYFAASGKTRLTFYNLGRAARGEETFSYSTEEAVGYCNSMRQGAIYDFADADEYSPDDSYFEYMDNTSLRYTPVTFLFTADTREKVLCGSDNGLYKFFDSIFGEKKEEAEMESDETVSEDIAVTEPSAAASAADAA